MRKKTLYALITLVVLVIAVIFVTKQKNKPPEYKKFVLSPIVKVKIEKKNTKDSKNSKQKTEKEKKPEDVVTKIEISDRDKSIIIEKQGKDDWFITKPRKMLADSYKVKKIINQFSNKLESIASKQIKSKSDLRYYGLDDKNKIRLKIYTKSGLYADLVIGNAEKVNEENYEFDTFIMKPDGKFIFRIAGINLREPIKGKIKDFRSKKIFTFKKDDIVEISIKNPEDKKYPEIVLKKEEVEGKTDKKGEKEDQKKGKKERWVMLKPGGFTLMNLQSYLSTLSSLYARDFTMTPEEDTGLKNLKNVYTITIKLKNGDEKKLYIGKEVKDHVWVKASGIDDYIKLSKYTAKAIKKRALDFREKKLFGFKGEEVTKLSFKNGDLHFSVVKKGNTWKFEGGFTNWVVGEDEISKILRDITSFRVDSYLDKDHIDLQKTGLSSPSTVVKINSGEYEVALGKEDKKEHKVYGYSKTTGDYFLCTKYNADKLMKKPLDFRKKKIFSFKKDEIKDIYLISKNETVQLSKVETSQGDKSKKAAEKSYEWKIVNPKGAGKLNKSKVESMLLTIPNLKVKEFFDKMTPKEAGITSDSFKLKIILNDDSIHYLTISDKKRDGNNYCISDEPGFKGIVFTINTYQINKVKKNLKELTSK